MGAAARGSGNGLDRVVTATPLRESCQARARTLFGVHTRAGMVRASTSVMALRTLSGRADRVASGGELRRTLPRSSHATWPPSTDDRPDPVDMLERSHAHRLARLAPVRWGRMVGSPFAFLRGSAMVMAWDLAHVPHSEIYVQACGDAHLCNVSVSRSRNSDKERAAERGTQLAVFSRPPKPYLGGGSGVRARARRNQPQHQRAATAPARPPVASSGPAAPRRRASTRAATARTAGRPASAASSRGAPDRGRRGRGR